MFLTEQLEFAALMGWLYVIVRSQGFGYLPWISLDTYLLGQSWEAELRYIPLVPCPSSLCGLVPRARHCFHSICISKWLAECRSSCPLCGETLQTMDKEQKDPVNLAKSLTDQTDQTDPAEGEADEADEAGSSSSSAHLWRWQPLRQDRPWEAVCDRCQALYTYYKANQLEHGLFNRSQSCFARTCLWMFMLHLGASQPYSYCLTYSTFHRLFAKPPDS